MNRSTVVLLTWLAVLVSACGGSGDDSGIESPSSTAFVAISGHVTFDLVPAVAGFRGVPRLDYNAVERRPVRQITVQILNDQTGALLGAVASDNTGFYSLSVPADTVVNLRARAELIQSGSPAWNFRVIDNTQSDALFVLDSAAFNTGTADSVRNLHAGSGWTGAAYTEARSAAPFAILDTIYDGVQFLLAVDPTLDFPPLTLHWSPDNHSAVGADGFPDPDSGEIGISFFSTEFGGIFLLGRANDDTEEYDRGVILHEWGHYVEQMFFRSDSLGGPHTLGDTLDMRVAFAEGFASAFAGMILGDGVLRDTFGRQQGSGFTIDVEDENILVLNPGWYSEESVQRILFDLFDTVQDTAQDQLAVGFGPLFDILANEQRESVALTSLFPFINALKTEREADASSIRALVEAQTIAPITDEYGSGRTNPAAIDVLPIYTDIVVNGGPVNDLCSTDAFGASLIDPESVNKLGSRRFLKFTTTVTGNHTFTATATEIPVGEVADPDMELHQRGALLPFPLVDPPGKSDDVNIESFSWPLTPGDYVLEVYEWTNTNPGDDPDFPPIGRTCFDVIVQTSGKPIPPIAISYEMLGEPRVGQPLEIRVTTRSQVVLTEVSVDVRGDERLVLVPGTPNRNVARVPSGEAMIRTVTVTPLLDGALHVSVLVRADINGRAQARSVLIPIQVGPSRSVPEADGTVKLEESGELIISLPAEASP